MPRRLKVTDVNPHVMCTICDGYLVDATTIIECLHAFCRTCIVRYLESSKYCPVCDVQVHKTKPLLSIRSDQTLQDLVYKVVPDLYQNEMQKRREFYAEHPEAIVGTEPEERGEGEPRFFSPKESISLCLQHRPKETKATAEFKDPTTRHLNCPAAFTVGHLKKFVHLKFSLPNTFAVDVFYDDHLLKDSFTLMDVAYIYSWKRAEPMKFFYTITKRVPKFVELPPPPPAASSPTVDMEQHLSDVACEPDKPEPMEIDSLPVEPEGADAFPAEPERADSLLPEPEIISSLPAKPKDVVSLSAEPKIVASLPSEPKTVVSLPAELKMVVSLPTESELLDSLPSKKKIVGPLPAESNTVGSLPAESSKNIPECGVAAIASSSGDDIQQMDVVVEPEETKSNSSSPSVELESTPAPLPVPEQPTYNSVKLVSAPEPNTLLSPTNGFRLKFIHDPQLSPPKSQKSSKKSGRKGGRSSRHKNVPVRLARLAPYPPPTCLTSTQHLTQLTVGKLVPSVITTLAATSTFVTTLVTTTCHSNTLCNNSTGGATSYPSQMSLPTISNSVSTNGEVVPSSTSAAGNDSGSCVSLSSTSPDLRLPTDTKELPSTEITATSAAPPDAAVPPSISPVLKVPFPTTTTTKDLITAVAVVTKVLPNANTNSHSSQSLKTALQPDESTPTNDSISLRTPSRRPDNVNSPTVVQPCSNGVESSETITSGSGGVNHSVPTSSTNSESRERSSPSRQKKIEEGEKQASTNAKEKRPKDTNMVVSAEFSDNDDLGCQPDLVVDEQKMHDDSSDNEGEEDAALRKKIAAIAEKEDETDDTEADSGRASDMSCPARCEDDVGSPVTTETAVVTSSATVSIASTQSSEDSHRHTTTKTNSIDHVIKQLYLQHEIGRSSASPKPPVTPSTPKDDSGALDLSTTYTRKPGEIQSTRPKSVANPVLDFKHRQQTYLPAPVKQHTACPPAPKHPTSSLLMHQLTTHHHSSTPSILQAQLTGNSTKPSHHHTFPFTIPVSRAVSTTPSLVSERPSPPSYGYKFSPNTAHQGIGMFSGMLPYPSMINMAAGYGMPSISIRSPIGQKDANNKASYVTHTKPGLMSGGRRISDNPSRSTLPSPTSGTPAHPRASPSVLSRLSPQHHRSASPAPSPQSVAHQHATISGQCHKSSHKKTDKGGNFGKFKRSSNLAVFNPDPNGFRQKLVIKNLDSSSRSNNHH